MRTKSSGAELAKMASQTAVETSAMYSAGRHLSPNRQPKATALAAPQRRSASVLPTRSNPVEHMIQLHIEKLPEGMYLATSDEVQGLVAQGRTIQETIEIARDVAKKLIEAQVGSGAALSPAREAFDYPLIVAT